MPRLYLEKFCFVSLINQHRSESSMVNIIIYLGVVSNFNAVQKPKIGIAIPYSFIRQWVVVAEPLINIFILVFCLRCPVVGTYRSLQWAVLHNERTLQDKRNSITVSLFSLFFVCLLYIHRCFAVLKIN